MFSLVGQVQQNGIYITVLKKVVDHFLLGTSVRSFAHQRTLVPPRRFQGLSMTAVIKVLVSSRRKQNQFFLKISLVFVAFLIFLAYTVQVCSRSGMPHHRSPLHERGRGVANNRCSGISNGIEPHVASLDQAELQSGQQRFAIYHLSDQLIYNSSL